MRSFIQEPNDGGIRAIVNQQFESAEAITRHGLMPIIEPEVSIKCRDKPTADRLLVAALQAKLDELPVDRQVMLKLTLPDEDNLYAPLSTIHAYCGLALSGGYSLAQSDDKLAAITPYSQLFAGLDRRPDRRPDRCRIRPDSHVEHRRDLCGLGHLTEQATPCRAFNKLFVNAGSPPRAHRSNPHPATRIGRQDRRSPARRPPDRLRGPRRIGRYD